MKYSKTHLQVHKFASKDVTRQAMNGVYFDNATTVATDGHQLMIVESGETKASEEVKTGPANDHNFKPFTLQDDNFKPFILPIENVKTLEKPLAGKTKSRNFEDSIELNLSESGKKVDAKLLDDGTASFKPVDGKFPNYKQVLPVFKKADGTPEDGYVKVCLDGRLLAEAAKFLATFDEGGEGSVFIYVRKDSTKNAEAAIMLESTGKHFGDSNLHGTALIMPVRY